MALQRNTPRAIELGAFNDLPVLGATNIFEGAAVGVNAQGLAREFNVSDIFSGFADAQANNRKGHDGLLKVRVRERGHIVLDVQGVSNQADIDKTVYALGDDQYSTSGSVAIGVVKRVEASGKAVVKFGIGGAAAGLQVVESVAGEQIGGFLAGARGSMNIRNARKIKRALAKLSLSTTRRINVGIHGMSIPFGWGVDGVSTYPLPASAKTNSVASILGKALNQEFGGTFTPGVDVIDNQSSIFTTAGGAGYPDIYATPGPNGVIANPSTGTVSFTVLGGRAGQVVRIYAIASTLVAVNAVYSLTGANTATDVQTPSSVPTGNTLPNAVQHWFEYTITLANAGDTVVLMKNAAPASTGVIGNNLLQIYMVDMDYRADPGVTVHRLCKPGRPLVAVCGWSLDDADVWPPGPNTAADWIGADDPTRNRRLGNLHSMVSRPALDLAICWFDINDVFYGPTGGFSEADHRRHLKNYMDGVIGLGVPVLFVAGVFRNPASVTPTQGQFSQQQMLEFYRDLSDASPDVCGAAFLDLSQNLMGKTLAEKYVEQWADTTFRVSGEGSSPLHPNQLFSAFIGQSIAAALMQAKNAV